MRARLCGGLMMDDSRFSSPQSISNGAGAPLLILSHRMNLKNIRVTARRNRLWACCPRASGRLRRCVLGSAPRPQIPYPLRRCPRGLGDVCVGESLGLFRKYPPLSLIRLVSPPGVLAGFPYVVVAAAAAATCWNTPALATCPCFHSGVRPVLPPGSPAPQRGRDRFSYSMPVLNDLKVFFNFFEVYPHWLPSLT